MKRLILDTTYLIDAERGGIDFDELIDDEDDVAVAAITIAELRVGVLMASRRHRAARAAYVEDVVAGIPILDYDLEVAGAHASLLAEVRSQGRPRGAHDLIIAATAKAFGRVVVTADLRSFDELSGVSARSYRPG